MARFPITRAREELGITPRTAVRAAIDVRTGEEAIGQAVSGLGVAMMKIGLQRKQNADLIEADTQSSAATREAIRVANEVNDLVFAAEETDEETFNKIASGLTQRINALRPKNEKAGRAFDRRMSILIPQVEEDIANARLGRIETDYLAEEQALWDELKITGNPEDLLIKLKKGKLLNITGRRTDAQLKPLQQTAMAVAADTSIKLALAGDDLAVAQSLLTIYADLLTPDQKIRLKNSIKTSLKVIEEKALNAAKEVLLNRIQGLSPEEAFAVIDADKTIPFDEKKGVRQEWSVREKARQEAAITIHHEEFWQLLRAGNLAELQAKVNVSTLPVTGTGGKDWWTKLVSTREKEIVSGLEPITISRIRSSLLSRVYEIATGTRTKQQIQQELLEQRYTQKTLDDTDFGMLWNRAEQEYKSWRGAQMGKTLREVRAQIVTIDESTMERMIDILRGEELEEIQTRRQGEEDKYAEAVFELESWLEANPEPTRDDFYKEKRRILRDYRNKTAEQIRQGRAEFKEVQTIQPTEEQLKAQAAAIDDVNERRRIYEQGYKLGYWR